MELKHVNEMEPLHKTYPYKILLYFWVSFRLLVRPSMFCGHWCKKVCKNNALCVKVTSGLNFLFDWILICRQ